MTADQLEQTELAPASQGEEITVVDLLARAMAKCGDSEAVVVPDGERLTFAELDQRVAEVAKGLIDLGVQPGDRVAMWMPNCLEWVLVYLATTTIGAVLVPVNTAFRVEEAAYVIAQSDSTVLVTTVRPGRRDFFADVADLLGRDGLSVRQVIAVDCGDETGWLSYAALVEAGKRVSEADLDRRRQAVLPTDLFLMLYTSGTTGFPKGVMHTHALIRNLMDAAHQMEQRRGDRLVLYMPLFHVFGATAILTFLHVGGTVIIMSGFDAPESLRTMQDERATIVYGINTMYYDQVNHPSFDEFDLSSVRLCLVPGTADLVRAAEKIGTAVNGYGMTECSSIITVARPDDPFELRGETVGCPLPGFEVKIIDPATGDTLDTGALGEICVRGFPVMAGYYNLPQQTANVVDGEGWFRTGDLGSLTVEGYVRLVGRAKDMVRVGGENVDPVEVEKILMRHPAVSLAAAFGIADERLGEVVATCVQLKVGACVEADELIELARRNLASFKTPRRIVFVDEMPKTSSGKIQRTALAALLETDPAPRPRGVSSDPERTIP
jgi:fatty-acyl-CoA synthase